jgi:cytochrome c biogenesis protein CcdA
VPSNRISAAPNSRRQPERGAALSRPGAPISATALRGHRRLRRFLVGLLALTWTPGLLGAAVGASALRSWSVVSGYAGLSWALPGLLTGLIVERAARGRASRLRRLEGLAAGCASAALLLVGAARIIGS